MFSFNRRKRQIDLQKYIRRLCDVTNPTLSPLDGDARSDNRHNRVIPTLLSPWEHRAPLTTKTVSALTKDISDRGVGLVLQHPFAADSVVLGVWLPQEETPWFFAGDIRQNSPIGGGYWVIGVELNDVLTIADAPELEKLLPFVEKLLPPNHVHAVV